MEDEQNRHSTGFQGDHARLVDHARITWNDSSLSGKIENSAWSHMGRGTSPDDRQERMETLDWLPNAQCARHGMME